MAGVQRPSGLIKVEGSEARVLLEETFLVKLENVS